MPHPLLYQMNTRVFLNDLSLQTGCPTTLDDIPDDLLRELSQAGFTWFWPLGVWQTGPAATRIARENPKQQPEYRHTLADLTEADVVSSCFAVCGYTASTEYGGEPALTRLRDRVHRFGMKLMLDFVPNHMAPDHPWVARHPDYFVQGTEEQLSAQPQNYTRIGDRIFAYGRDPYFDGWSDTVQLNYGNPQCWEAMRDELLSVASRCDGVRCDMAMLLLPDVFARTWGIPMEPFWPAATQAVRMRHPDFTFMAEVYWDLEWTLQQQGFDYTYDKRLYDRLRDGHAAAVRGHLMAELDFQNKSARFLENHDEPRAAAVFPAPWHRAAAVVTFFAPGLRFFHQGQFQGRRIRIPMQIRRSPQEQPDLEIRSFYETLIEALRDPIFREGEWQQICCLPAWDGNWTAEEFLAFEWSTQSRRAVGAVNYSDHQSQCYVPLSHSDLANRQVRFRDLMSSAVYDRDGNEILARGLYLDMPAWGYHIFAIETA